MTNLTLPEMANSLNSLQVCSVKDRKVKISFYFSQSQNLDNNKDFWDCGSFHNPIFMAIPPYKLIKQTNKKLRVKYWNRNRDLMAHETFRQLASPNIRLSFLSYEFRHLCPLGTSSTCPPVVIAQAGVTRPGHKSELPGGLYKTKGSQFSIPEMLFRRYFLKRYPRRFYDQQGLGITGKVSSSSRIMILELY